MNVHVHFLDRMPLKAAHTIDILVRINGQEQHYPGDWLRELRPAFEALAAISRCGICGSPFCTHTQGNSTMIAREALRNLSGIEWHVGRGG